MRSLVLASQSPRRQELLQLCGFPFRVVTAAVAEHIRTDIPLAAAIEHLAYQKARAVLDQVPDALVLGADTIVCLDGVIFGKPKDETDARSMLKRLSGRTHQVISGVCLLAADDQERFHSRSEVTFYELSDAEIATYVAGGEGLDKAGGYGIQDHGAVFVKAIQGDYYTIMGLPVAEVYHRLKRIERGKD